MTAASDRVVGMPSAAIASLMMYSRSTGPRAARPSPRRENGVGPEPLSWMSRRTPSRAHDLAQQDGAAVAELRHEVAELVAGIGKRNRLGAERDAVARQDRHALRRGQRCGIEAELGGECGVELDQARRGDRRRRKPHVEALRQAGVAVVERQRDGAAGHRCRRFLQEETRVVCHLLYLGSAAGAPQPGRVSAL